MKTFPKSILLFFVLFIVAPYILSAQKAPEIQWQICLGGTHSEDPDWSQFSIILQTTDGGYVVAGRAVTNDGDISGNHGRDDAWIVKLNSSGKIQWQKCLGGTGTENASCVIQTSDNGFAIAGFSGSNDGDVTGMHGYTDAWVVKLDVSGNIEWQKCFGGSGFEIAYSIIQTSDGGYAIGGAASSSDGDVSRNLGSEDAWVVKLSSSGEMQWEKSLGGSGWDNAHSIIQTSDGGYAVAGFTESAEEPRFNHGKKDAFIVKLDSTGKELWEKLIGGPGDDAANSILQTSDGGYIFAGNLNGNFYTLTGDAWVVRLDTIGRILWEKTLGGSNGDAASTIIHTVDGGYAVVGTTNSYDGDVSGKHRGIDDSTDVWVVKLSTSGTIEWQKCLGGYLSDYGFGIAQTTDDGYIVSGITFSYNGDVSGNHNSLDKYSDDIWVVKLRGTKNGVDLHNADQTSVLSAFPNPSFDQLQLQLSSLHPVKQILFFDVMGVQYFPEYQLESTIATVDVHTLPTGSFVARVVYLDQEQTQLQKFLHYR